MNMNTNMKKIICRNYKKLKLKNINDISINIRINSSFIDDHKKISNKESLNNDSILKEKSIIYNNNKGTQTTSSNNIKKLIQSNLLKYSTYSTDYDSYIINSFFSNKKNLYSFKLNECKIENDTSEFLNKYYSLVDSIDKLKKYSYFYIIYLHCFCKPKLNDLYLNKILSNNIDKKAQDFYNKNYDKSSNLNKNNNNINQTKIQNVFFNKTLINELEDIKLINDTYNTNKNDISSLSLSSIENNKPLYNKDAHNSNNNNKKKYFLDISKKDLLSNKIENEKSSNDTFISLIKELNTSQKVKMINLSTNNVNITNNYNNYKNNKYNNIRNSNNKLIKKYSSEKSIDLRKIKNESNMNTNTTNTNNFNTINNNKLRYNSNSLIINNKNRTRKRTALINNINLIDSNLMNPHKEAKSININSCIFNSKSINLKMNRNTKKKKSIIKSNSLSNLYENQSRVYDNKNAFKDIIRNRIEKVKYSLNKKKEKSIINLNNSNKNKRNNSNSKHFLRKYNSELNIKVSNISSSKKIILNKSKNLINDQNVNNNVFSQIILGYESKKNNLYNQNINKDLCECNRVIFKKTKKLSKSIINNNSNLSNTSSNFFKVYNKSHYKNNSSQFSQNNANSINKVKSFTLNVNYNTGVNLNTANKNLVSYNDNSCLNIDKNQQAKKKSKNTTVKSYKFYKDKIALYKYENNSNYIISNPFKKMNM